MAAVITFILIAVAVSSIAFAGAKHSGGIVLKAEGDGGSNSSGGDSGLTGNEDFDLPF